MTELNRSYATGFVDGVEYAIQLNLEDTLRSFAKLADEFRRKKSALDKVEFILKRFIKVLNILRNQYGLWNGFRPV